MENAQVATCHRTGEAFEHDYSFKLYSIAEMKAAEDCMGGPVRICIRYGEAGDALPI